jgi:hypothetical protein
LGLSDVAGVFSRYFVVGFFLPAFFALVALSQTLNAALLPAIYRDASPGAQIAILGGAALPVGLTLLGLNYQIIRLYEGYPLAAQAKHRVIRPLYKLLLSGQKRRFKTAWNMCMAGTTTEAQRRVAEWTLDRRFPRRQQTSMDDSLLLPTSFGNAVRAFERHSFLLWYLESIAIWPYIELLLSDQETQTLSDTKGDVAFFINVSLVSLLSAGLLAFDMVAYRSAPSGFYLLIPVAVALMSYRAAIGAAINWGEIVRACIDLHRRDAYAKLGLRAPVDYADERWLAWNLTQASLTSSQLPDELAATPSETDHDAANPIT